MNLLRRLMMVALAAAWIGLAGCSDDDGDKLDAAMDAAVDTFVQDMTEDAPVLVGPEAGADAGPSNMGAGCQKTGECTGKDAICLTVSKTKGAGFCSMSCTPDDPKTPLINEDNCPKNFNCSGILMTSGATNNYCLQECTPSFTKNPCDPASKVTCHPTSSRLIGPKKAVCFYTACQTDKDCPVWSDTACQKDTDCTAVGTGAFCDDNFCALPGKCTAGGLCGKHPGVGKPTAKVGDPCKNDLECMENGRCLFEDQKNEGSFGVGYRNGYCVIRYCMFPNELTDFACDSSSVCNHLYYGGYCFKACKLNDATTCRGNSGDKGGDYECYDWSGWTTSGVKVAAGPMCLDSTGRTCDSLGSTSQCSSIGDGSNTTNMKCRDRYTGKAKTDPKDPKGICLDDTASGPFDTTGPDAGLPDAGASDAGAADAGAADAGAADAGLPDAGTAD